MNYQPLIFDEKQIIKLYQSNNWENYLKNKHNLFEGIKSSLDVIGAYDGEMLVGLIRTVGDGQTIVYIQDILVLPSYQNKGIGKALLQLIVTKYRHVRQIVLTTGLEAKQKQFYEKNGFKNFEDLNLRGFYYKK
jgi:GNAT superfamily N-acetyltransferase